jgi:electron transfer flavoprotein alpha subunit
VANILTYIELEENEATPKSLAALNAGRIIATELGATLYALLPCAETPTYDDDDIIAVLSRHGADKVILISHPRLAPPAFFVTHGEALKTVCRQFPPKLLLFPASTAGHDLAPRVAVSISARYAPNATIEQDGHSFNIARRVFRRRLIYRQPLAEGEGPLVLTLAPEDAPAVLGDDEAEVVVVHAPVDGSSPLELVAPPNDAGASLSTAQIVVAGGAGLESEDDFELIKELARRLGGAPAATRKACERGFAPPELRVGLDGADAATARLYLAFGVSGSDHHLAGLGPQTTVVAVNTDRDAPIFKIARYRIVADARQTLQDLLEQVRPPTEGVG